MTYNEAEIIRLKSQIKILKTNWSKLRDMLQLTVELYADDDDIDSSVAEAVLDQMDVIERGPD